MGDWIRPAVTSLIRVGEVEQVAGWISAGNVVALTGAGISTGSGIPDYRGPNGLWTKDPSAARMSTYADYVSDPEVRRRAWQSRGRHPAFDAQPNAGHRALVDLERRGLLDLIVTQNIDGLHQKAGSTPERVIEVHGTIHEAECVECGARSPMSEELVRVAAGDPDPACRRCGGIVKSATISFGQPLDRAVFDRARQAAGSCDLLLAVGSSLSVQPAAGLCGVATGSGARLVVVNAQPTPYDELADAVIRNPIESVLPALVEQAVAA
jgi:NAD-dependent deacetylase